MAVVQQHRLMMSFPGVGASSHAILAAAHPYTYSALSYQDSSHPPQPDRPIGYGAFGVVWAVTDPRDGKRVALKKMPNVFQNLIAAKRVYRELRMLCSFKHDNVISSLDILQPPQIDLFQEIYVVTELMQSDLHKIIVSPQTLTADHVKVFLYQILRGVTYLHSANVVHRDIKPGNLLVNSNCCLKICDFGLARVSEPDERRSLTQEVVTQYYRAPEILMGAKHYSNSVDVWSIGCIFAELLSRRILFQAQSPVQQLNLIVELLGTPSQEDMKLACEPARQHVLRLGHKHNSMTTLYNLSAYATHEAVDLLSRLLVFNPSRRMSAEQALSHPYLDEGRLRFHACMCTCCSTLPSGTRQYCRNLDPTSNQPFSYTFEDELTSLSRIRDKLFKLMHDQQQLSNKVPLCLNPLSTAFKTFASSQCAQPSEMPPSPHVWE